MTSETISNQLAVTATIYRVVCPECPFALKCKVQNTCVVSGINTGNFWMLRLSHHIGCVTTQQEWNNIQKRRKNLRRLDKSAYRKNHSRQRNLCPSGLTAAPFKLINISLWFRGVGHRNSRDVFCFWGLVCERNVLPSTAFDSGTLIGFQGAIDHWLLFWTHWPMFTGAATNHGAALTIL